ncbi:MAG TPA: ABC transporter ATP-binding protein [Noviherbaspirillum sp.]|uniref:ABC transporter ATP-binding protein n=1 Tax=Noviherbaspirillum sp. TaxID=1926288 RepID=UPI002D6C7032|nr:ABC transporter ATP-binding protein [Noviherbaspirillum sp.]HYD95265.1 ABC transporter ATP-binding protein [Noviherbaspirillum sp.]
MASVRLRGIGKSFGDQEVIKGIDLDIADGEFVVLVGPSGCGKTTLLRIIAGLESPTKGEIDIDGRRSNDIAAARRGMAMVFQSYALYPHMTVAENMGFALKLAGVAKEEIAASVSRAADILQIGHLLDRRPKALSGGQRQRVAIGRAIVRRPGVFLFDEPLSNLDAALRAQTRVEIARLHKELKTTTIYVTHDQAEAMTLGEKIVVLNAGIIEQAGTPLDLYARPANRFVAGFLGSPRMNFLDAQLESIAESDTLLVSVRLTDGTLVHVAANTNRAESGTSVTLGVRPEQFTVMPRDPAPGAIAAKVAVIEHLGDSMIVYAQVEGMPDLMAVKCGADAPVPPVGSGISLAFRPTHAHLFDPHGVAFAPD